MEFKHFSHHHNLNLYQLQDDQTLRCSGCESLCHDKAYACWQCNYFLHEHCGNAIRYMKRHPSHTIHPLILIPKPTYCSGSFICNACGDTGSAFSYCCTLCEVDLHVHCAFLPPKVSHKCHQHELTLYHGGCTKNGQPEYCKICTKSLDPKNWSYFCDGCEFGVHTSCATNEVKPELYWEVPSDSETVPAQQNASGEEQNEPSAEEVIVGLYNLQLQMQMADQFAKMMASFNPGSFI